jgi:membrane protein
MTMPHRIDRFQRRHPILEFPLAVLYKYVDDSGAYLAAIIAYYGLVSLFPLLLLMSTILGLVLVDYPHLQHEVLNSALHEFPVVGSQLSDPKRISGGAIGLIVGIVGSVYGGLGVAQAVQYAMNTAWRVPRNDRPNPFKARARSLLVLATGGVAVIATTALSALGASGAGSFGVAIRILVLAASVALNAAVFVFVFRIATARTLSISDVAPGALTAAIIWQLLQSFGVLYVSHVVRHVSDTNAVFAFVLGLIAFLYLSAAAMVLCVEVNVVRVDRLHPRSLMTPFTDNVTLTPGDRRAYTTQAEAQQMKGFQDVDVSFDERNREAGQRSGD